MYIDIVINNYNKYRYAYLIMHSIQFDWIGKRDLKIDKKILLFLWQIISQMCD